ncbi:uncharacterized protein LOC133202148 [Saccostrea echinata]|uniref:uncharacterized protein LOC133202148 n=1 Tax=Saccostrea echinata TaxID=191078 RepID=UPI002A81E80F|nr:uncharacterized protein LOC133202148 [Saccostrea echinata]
MLYFQRSGGAYSFALSSCNAEPYHQYRYNSAYHSTRQVTVTTSRSYERHQDNRMSPGYQTSVVNIPSARQYCVSDPTEQYCDNDFDSYERWGTAECSWGYHSHRHSTHNSYEHHGSPSTDHVIRSGVRYNPYKKVTYKDGKAEPFYDIKYKSPLFRLHLSQQPMRFRCTKSRRQCKREPGKS